MRFGLSARFISLIAAILAVVFTAVTLLIIVINTSRLRSGLENDVKAFSALATGPIGDAYVLYADSGTVRIAQEIEKFTDLDANISNVQIIDTQGKVLFDQKKSPSATVSETDASSFNPSYVKSDKGYLNRIVYPYIEDLGLHRYAVVYDVSSASINESIAQTAAIILAAAIIALLFTSVITYLFVSKFFLQPIKRISATSALITSGRYDQQIVLTRRDELGLLAGSLNSMANRLKSDITKLKEVDELKSEFMVIASHNLRTPITAINMSVETIRATNPTGVVASMTDSVAANGRRLGAFAEDMLAIATMEAGEKPFELKLANASSIFLAVPDFQTLAKEKGIEFKADVQVGKSQIMASIPHLRAALWNLVDNSIKFTEKGGKIGFSAIVLDHHMRITIVDSGVGIATDEIPKLFTKFHRGTSVMRYNYEGTGLGLYLTKLIVDRHHGTIDVQSQLGKGTTITVDLPTGPKYG